LQDRSLGEDWRVFKLQNRVKVFCGEKQKPGSKKKERCSKTGGCVKQQEENEHKTEK